MSPPSLTLEETITGLEQCSQTNLFSSAVHHLKRYKEKWYDLETIIHEQRELNRKITEKIERYEEAIHNCDAVEAKYQLLLRDFDPAKFKTN